VSVLQDISEYGVSARQCVRQAALAVKNLFRSIPIPALPRSTAPRSLIAFLGNAVTAITVLAPPLAFAVIGYIQLHYRAKEHATVSASHIQMQLLRSPEPNAIQEIAVGVLHATKAADDTILASWVTDNTGSIVMFDGRSAFWPEIRVQAPVKGAGFEGHMHIASTTRGIFVGTFNVALAFLLLGVAAHYCFRRLPLAALDEALARLHRNQAELEEKNVRFDTAMDHMSQGLCMFDKDQRILVCNKSYAQLYGLKPEQVRPGTTLREIVQHRIANGFYAGNSPETYMNERTAPVTASSNTVQELCDGRFISIARRPMASGGWVTTHEDISEQRRAEAQIAFLAHHDPLTHLPNRVLLRQRLDQALARVHRGEKLAMLCLDLDRFKEVNDTLGHAVGDALLKAVAERIKSCIREIDTLGRVSGDEFAIVLCPITAPDEAMHVASRIVEIMKEPFVLLGHQVMVGASVGVALSPDDGVDGEELLRCADLALYRAKNEQRGTYRFFEPQMNSHLVERRDLELALRGALTNGEFEIYYQPTLNLEHNQVRGFEALLRWHRPGFGTVSPAQFIPLAEETGLILPIGDWVVRQACMQAAAWPDHIIVSVNLSPIQFKSRNLLQTIVSALAASGIKPSRLELEITESILVQDNDTALAMLKELRSLGVKIALDDFGTGYSSLSYLQKFPFDKIKIDRSFVRDLESGNLNALAIVTAVVELGRSLGMSTTAEGVETADQLDIVRRKGCTEIQGYLLSPPKPVTEIDRLGLASARSANAA
jgi:diguanylate cyclase (GGDEF)-like protein